ncbi:MAG: hypothetical protein QM705_10695 [Ancrocorticia sp.]
MVYYGYRRILPAIVVLLTGTTSAGLVVRLASQALRHPRHGGTYWRNL